MEATTESTLVMFYIRCLGQKSALYLLVILVTTLKLFILGIHYTFICFLKASAYIFFADNTETLRILMLWRTSLKHLLWW
jgi:hypothetical protein